MLLAIVGQIAVVDIVFSLDSVITAVGMVDQIGVILRARKEIQQRCGPAPVLPALKPKTLSDLSQLNLATKDACKPANIWAEELESLLPRNFLTVIPFEQLTHIPRPGITAEHLQRLVAKMLMSTVMASSKEDDQSLCEVGDIIGPFPERRNFYLDDIQPIEEVFAETIISDGVLDIHVSRCNQADIRFPGHMVAETFVFPFLDEP